MKTALSIAGSDSCGGAGIQADIKTMTMNGVYAMTAITALTAQNTTGVRAIQEATPAFLKEQLDAVFEDIFPDAVKIGMVSSSDLIRVIAERLRHYGAKNIVVDPVMVATSGSSLMKTDAVQTLIDELLPLSTVITPNIPEGEILSSEKIESRDDMERAAKRIGDTYGCEMCIRDSDSTEEHLTVTQFKVAKEKQRLEAVTAELNQKEAQLDDTTQAAEKKKQELKSLQAQTKAATGIAVTVQELESMGKKSFTGNIVLTPDECRTLKNYAVSSFAEKAEKLKYQQKYETAKKDAGVWKKRYEKLLEQAQPYLDAVKLAPERVRAFLNAVLTRGKEKQDIPQERGRKRKESTIDR